MVDQVAPFLRGRRSLKRRVVVFSVLGLVVVGSAWGFAAHADVSSLYGQVSVPEGSVLQGVGVRVLAVAPDGSESVELTEAWSGGTDTAGHFDAGSLDPGTYLVVAGGGDLGAVFFPGVVSVDAATVFTVVAGQVVDVGAVTLDSAGSISGTVNDHLGQPAVGALVEAVPEVGEDSGVSQTINGTAQVDATGQFVIDGLVSATYQVLVAGDDLYLPASSRDLDGVGSGVVVQAGAAVELEAGFERQLAATLSGRLVDAGGEPVAGVDVQTAKLKADGGWEPFDITVTDAAGEFGFGWLPAGTYSVQVARSRLVPGVGLGSLAAAGGSTTLTAGQAGQVGDIVVGRGGAVSGEVVGVSGEPVPGLKVVAFQQFDDGEGVSWEAVDDALTDGVGHFSVGALEPGSVLVWVSGGDDFLSVYSNGQRFEEQAQAFTVAEGSTVEVGVIQLSAAGKVTGHVQPGLEQLAVGGMVLVYEPEGQIAAGGQIGQDGSFTVGGLYAGDYFVRVFGSADGVGAVAPSTEQLVSFQVADGGLTDVGVVPLEGAAQ